MGEFKEILSREKQYEIMYSDMQMTIADRKSTLFEISRWHVTLQSLIIGFIAYNGENIEKIFIIAPLLVGVMGYILLKAISDELNSHRKTIALLRKNVGDDFYTIHKEMVDYFLEGKTPSATNYWKKIGNSYFWIITISTLASFCSVSLILL